MTPPGPRIDCGSSFAIKEVCRRSGFQPDAFPTATTATGMVGCTRPTRPRAKYKTRDQWPLSTRAKERRIDGFVFGGGQCGDRENVSTFLFEKLNGGIAKCLVDQRLSIE